MSECTHDCSTCSANCSSRQPSKEDFLEKLNDLLDGGLVTIIKDRTCAKITDILAFRIGDIER